MASLDAFQSSVYIGINIENILYGMELLLYFKTIHTILSSRTRKKADTFYALFSSVMVLLVTIWVATQAMFGEEAWLLNPNFPGGPDIYMQEHIADWYMDWGTTAAIILQLMTDGLMIYRCWIVWNSYYVVIAPIVLWLATLVLGFLVDWTSSIPGSNFFSGIPSELALAYYTVSVFLNATMTCMICYRIVQHGQKMQEQLGREHASFYFTITIIIVESVLPYTISGIAFLVSLGTGSPTSVAFICVYVMMMSISPQWLILRVILGSAWDVDKSRTSAAQIPNTESLNSGSQRFDSTGARAHLQTLSNAIYLSNGGDKV